MAYGEYITSITHPSVSARGELAIVLAMSDAYENHPDEGNDHTVAAAPLDKPP